MLNETAAAVLDGQVRHVRRPHVFVDKTGQSYHGRDNRNCITKRTKDTMRAAGIQDATFHTLRHTAASWMVQAGRPLAEIRAILGHATMQTTLRYAHLQPQHLRASMATLDATMRGEMDTQMDTSANARGRVGESSRQVQSYKQVAKVGR